jgi:curved DNA-binding protein CbpA
MAESTERWFIKHGLPWTNEIETSLSQKGVTCVEHLKILKKSFVDNLFSSQSFIVKESARIAWADLGGKETFDFAKTKDTIPIDDVGAPSPPPSKKSKTSHNNRAVQQNDSARSVLNLGFSKKMVKTKEQKIAEREERKSKKLNELDDDDDDVIEVVSPSAAASTESAVIVHGSISSNNISSTPTKLLALPPPDYRDGRCMSSGNLLNAATAEEKVCWTLNLLPKDKQCKNLEDPQGHYKIFGCSKVSSDDEIEAAYKKLHTEYKEMARVNHPDKTDDTAKHDVFKKAKDEWDRVGEAHDTLCSLTQVGNMAYPTHMDRVTYDLKGENLRQLFREEFEKQYNNETFDTRAALISEEEKRKNIYSKGHATRIANKEKVDPPLTLVVKTYKKTGQQDNKSRISIVKAYKAGKTKSEITREIRLKVYGVSHMYNICSLYMLFLCIQSHLIYIYC